MFPLALFIGQIPHVSALGETYLSGFIFAEVFHSMKRTLLYVFDDPFSIP